ncbi:hypothetical protein ACFXB3_40245 [Streptomyces sp. NPDC059447]|uniref:hypothetical protein n=1 Tax=Streptomyces sp. NPDC059447 TaxID=3346834 RepID=UPI003684CD6F
MTHLTAEEYEAVRAAVAVGARGRSWTLNSLFAAWRDVVEDVEEGYGLSAPEFGGELTCRDVLAATWPLLPPRVRAVRRPGLDELDGRFRAATTPWPDRPEEPPQWWHRRIPLVLEAEAGLPRPDGWPLGWEFLPFPKPDGVRVVEWSRP